MFKDIYNIPFCVEVYTETDLVTYQNFILINSAKLNEMRSVYVRHNIVIINLSVFNQRISFPRMMANSKQNSQYGPPDRQITYIYFAHFLLNMVKWHNSVIVVVLIHQGIRT